MKLFTRGEEKNLKFIRRENAGYIYSITPPSENRESIFCKSPLPLQIAKISEQAKEKDLVSRPRRIAKIHRLKTFSKFFNFNILLANEISK